MFLISILLFFAIPESLKADGFESGVLFVVIISTSLIMAVSLMVYGKKQHTEIRKNSPAPKRKEGNADVTDMPLD